MRKTTHVKATYTSHGGCLQPILHNQPISCVCIRTCQTVTLLLAFTTRDYSINDNCNICARDSHKMILLAR